MNALLSDLALILMVAGVVTIVFKKLKQPLVLGYIVAGVFAGPHVTFLPTVAEVESIDFWGKIGVIFLLFGLGLDFNFKKLKKVGRSSRTLSPISPLKRFKLRFKRSVN